MAKGSRIVSANKVYADAFGPMITSFMAWLLSKERAQQSSILPGSLQGPPFTEL